ncbi:ferritin family protein [Haloparvum sp. AD34]
MDPETFREQVESAADTELDRLGSNKLLLAVTGADLTTEAVLRNAVAAERASRDTFAEWADAEADPDVRAVFERVADQERKHLERVRAELEAVVGGDVEVADGDGDDDVTDDAASDGAVHESLRERTDTVERVAAGLIGRGLVSLRTHTQYVSFFVNEADSTRADLFRELKADVEADVETGLELLAEHCDEDDWQGAEAAAAATIDAAYEEYEAALTELGMDPKPVC